MSNISLAFPVSILLAALSIPSVGPVNSSSQFDLVPPGMAQSASPTHEDVIKPGLSQAELGDLYLVRKDYREASLTFKRLSDQEPTNAVYLNKLGIALHQQAALNLALRYYERAVKADPKYADAENNIGTIWYQRKKYRKAIKAYKQALVMRTDMPVLYSNLGYAYFEDKKYEESIQSFREALRIDPQFFERTGNRSGSLLQDRTVSDRGRFYFLLAKSFAESGNFERCELYLRKAKEEGYLVLAAARADMAFSAVLKDPAILEELSAKAK